MEKYTKTETKTIPEVKWFTCSNFPEHDDNIDAQSTKDTVTPTIKRFRFLPHKMSQQNPGCVTIGTLSIGYGSCQLAKYLRKLQEKPSHESWYFKCMHLTSGSSEKMCMTNFRQLLRTLLSATASQSCIERVFSVCDWLTGGRRNRMSKSLQMRACLKLNHRILTSTGLSALPPNKLSFTHILRLCIVAYFGLLDVDVEMCSWNFLCYDLVRYWKQHKNWNWSKNYKQKLQGAS